MYTKCWISFLSSIWSITHNIQVGKFVGNTWEHNYLICSMGHKLLLFEHLSNEWGILKIFQDSDLDINKYVKINVKLHFFIQACRVAKTS